MEVWHHEDMEQVLAFIKEAYGTRGIFTSGQLLSDLPRELRPAGVEWARTKQGKSTSLAAALKATGRVEAVGRANGRTLWRLVRP